IVDELRGLNESRIGLCGDELSGFLPGNRGVGTTQFRCHLDCTLCGCLETIVFLENFERSDVVPVVILPLMHESGFRMDAESGFANLLAGKAPRRQAGLVETVRNGGLVDVAGRMRYVKDHYVVKRQAMMLTKYRAVSASESSNNVVLSSVTSSSSAGKCPSASRRERSAVRHDRTRFTAFSASSRSVEFRLPSSFS